LRGSQKILPALNQPPAYKSIRIAANKHHCRGLGLFIYTYFLVGNPKGRAAISGTWQHSSKFE
jgi:hypothetical protein